MKTKLLMLAFLFVVMAKAQTTLKPVINPQIKYLELETCLNRDQDSILIKSVKIIDKVEILNVYLPYNYEIYCNSKEVKVSIRDVPCGRFVLGVLIDRKLILMSIERK